MDLGLRLPPGCFEVRLGSVPEGRALPYELYRLNVANELVSLGLKGKVIGPAELLRGALSFGERVYVRDEDRAAYLLSLRERLEIRSKDPLDRSRTLKESAFLHFHDLFTRNSFSETLNEAKPLLDELLHFASTDVVVTAQLLRLSVHDYYTYNHCVNVAVYAVSLAKRVFGDDRNRLLAAGLGGLLHDVGKRELPWDTINKPGSLSQEEWVCVRKHPEYGAEALAHVTDLDADSKLAVLEHHEAFEGGGYPKGLAGEEISIIARIVTIADVFDALTTDRSYHRALAPEDAMRKMFAMQPGKFDPELFKFFCRDFSPKGAEPLPEEFDPCTPQRLAKKKA